MFGLRRNAGVKWPAFISISFFFFFSSSSYFFSVAYTERRKTTDGYILTILRVQVVGDCGRVRGRGWRRQVTSRSGILNRWWMEQQHPSAFATYGATSTGSIVELFKRQEPNDEIVSINNTLLLDAVLKK